MPEIIMERPKMSLQMHENLKRFILRERRRKKEEDEQKLREEKKKAEIKTQNLEQNKEQIVQLERKLEDLQLKKRELFNQLKKVLNEETNLKKSTRVSVGQGSVTEQANTLNPLLMYSGHPGHPQLLTPQNSQYSQAAPMIPVNPQASQSKPQSPFHLMPPHHMPPQASNYFKYFNQTIPAQMMQNQPPLLIPPSSPNSSAHMMSSSPRHSIQSSSNIKRQRSPSPSRSPFNQANLVNSQFLFNQNQLMQRSISPCSIIASSPPPANFSSPNSSKKVRSNVNQSPQSVSARNQQSQSAFNSYLNRSGMSTFQSPSSQKGPMPPQTPPGTGSYQLTRGMPTQSQSSNMPPMPLPQGFSHHYLNSMSQEQAKMLLQSQQFMPQSYLPNMSNIPMISAAAIAAVAAASANSHQPSSNSGSGSGSIMTGFIRNPPNQ